MTGSTPEHHNRGSHHKKADEPTEDMSLWETLNPPSNGEMVGVASSYAAISQDDRERKKLLKLSRETSPISTITRLDKISRTVLPRLLKQPVQWAVIAVYAASATTARLGVDIGLVDGKDFNGAGTMVTFMIIFYVGYCYNRYQMYFMEAQRIMVAIQNSVSFARTIFMDQEEVHRLWRHLNLLHTATYCGLANYYSVDNFFNPVVNKFTLFGEAGPTNDYEREAFGRVNLDEDGSRACHMCELWAIQNIQAQFDKGERSRRRSTPR